MKSSIGCKAQKSTHTHTHTHWCLCKLIFSIIAIAIIFPSYSDPVQPTYDINAGANSANCVSDTLHATSGNVNLNANWSANTVNITYYSDNSEFTTGSCVYDQSLLIPQTEPQKTGYTFGGWKVKMISITTPNCSEINDRTTCNDTSGCAYLADRYVYGTGWTYKCREIIPIETAPYTSCLEITDSEICEKIYSVNWDDNGGFICYWDTYDNKCHVAAESGRGMMYPEIPKEWCQNFGDEWIDCQWYEPGEHEDYEEAVCECDYD